MSVIVGTAENFDDVLRAGQPVLVDFWAEWCGPCRAVSPVIEELAGQYASEAKVVKVNVDENQELAQRFGVMSIPTLLFFKEGREADKIVGAVPKAAIEKKLKNLLGAP